MSSSRRDPSSGRPPCPHYPDCVGCGLIGMAYGAQLEVKRRRLADALAAYPSLRAVAVPRVIGAPHVFGYRNQAKLVARRTRDGLLLGVYRPGTHQVIDISACPVHQPPINAVLGAVREAAADADVPIYDERRGVGWLRYVVVRSSAWQKTAQLILVVRDRAWSGERALLRRLMRVRGVSSVVLNLNPSPGNAILGETFVGVPAQPLRERLGALRLGSSPGAFLQANTAAARRVYEYVVRAADPQPGERVVDLYAGVGAIGLYLAGAADRVIGVEASAVAVADARRNARANVVYNVSFLAATAAEGLARAAAELGHIAVVTLNPPRKGADEACRRAIAACAPGRVVYVSCEPGSLVRDLDWFAARGYAVSALQPYDLLPQTEHIETAVLLRRTGAAD